MLRSADFQLRHDWHSLIDANKTMAEYAHVFYPHADDLVKYQRAVAADLNIVYDTSVLGTEWEASAHASAHGSQEGKTAGTTAGTTAGGVHRVTTDKGAWTGDHLIVATGYRMRDPPKCLTRPGVPWTFATYVGASAGLLE